MRATRTGQERKRSGQYGSKSEAMCVCGKTLGNHMAEPPYDLDETGCAGFKKAKVRKLITDLEKLLK